jgi:tyrosine-protein phosphatase YwqE
MSHKTPEPRIFKHQKLMNELNDMMIRIKRHLFFIPGDTIKPTNKELDELTNKIINVLRKNNEPMIKYVSDEDKSHGNPDCCPGCGNSVYNCKCQ